MNYLKSSFALIALIYLLPLTAQINKDDLTKAIDFNTLHHPYLYFTEEEKPDILKRIKNDPEYADIYTKQIAEANRLIYTPVETKPPAVDKNPRFSGDWDYHYYIEHNLDNALTLAFCYQMTGDRRYADKAFEFADVVCDVPNWDDRAHQFPIIYSRVMPWNVPDDQVLFNYDLYAAETAHRMGVVYDWLYDALDVRSRDRIRGALMEKSILLVRNNWDYYWWAWAYRCNWLTHCASGTGMAALALLTENPEFVDVIAESFNRIWKTYDEIGVDGGWQEGTGYSFANQKWAVFYGVPLKRLTGGKYTILNHPRMKENPVSFILWTLLPPDQKVNFGDTGPGVIRNATVLNTLAQEYKSPEAAWYASSICGSGNTLWDIIFPRTTIAPELPSTQSRHFRTIDYVVMRSSFTDLETVTLACKAGRHTDPHHGHLDCGDWDVHWRGESYIRGIGNIPYDEKCFDDVRWTYPQAGSQGQNVIFVNGERQIPGKWRGKPMDESIGGDLLEYRHSEELDYVLMDGTNAYPKKELKGWRRHLILDKPVLTVVLDEIKSNPGALIESRIHPIGDVEVPDDNAYLLLKGKHGMMALIAVTDLPVRYVSRNHGYLPVQKKAMFTRIPYVDIVLNASKTETAISTIVLPVADKTEARAVAESVKRSVSNDGALTISFTSGGHTHEYLYKRGKDGLILVR